MNDGNIFHQGAACADYKQKLLFIAE